MNLRFLTVSLISVFVMACGSPALKKDEITDTSKIPFADTLTEEELESVDESLPAYVIFGKYCGRCSRNCASMFCYSVNENNVSLMADYSDGYLSKNGRINCHTQLLDTSKISMVSAFVQSIPVLLREKTPSGHKFGCPDCTDACGLYLEIKDNKEIKKFYLDTQSSLLTGEIRDFAEKMKEVIEKLKS